MGAPGTRAKGATKARCMRRDASDDHHDVMRSLIPVGGGNFIDLIGLGTVPQLMRDIDCMLCDRGVRGS